MEEKTQTSFIPKSRTPSRGDGTSTYNSFTITGVTVFLIVVLVSTGLFLYQKYLEAEIRGMTLPDIDQIFDPAFLQDVILADAWISSTEKLLDNRIAPTTVFLTLENLTADRVYFNSFSYRSHKIEQSGETVVVLEGFAPSFNAVAFQSDVFKKEENIKEANIGNIRLREGRIFFEATLNFEPRVLLYKETI